MNYIKKVLRNGPERPESSRVWLKLWKWVLFLWCFLMNEFLCIPPPKTLLLLVFSAPVFIINIIYSFLSQKNYYCPCCDYNYCYFAIVKQTQLAQVQNDCKEKLEKEVSAREQLEKVYIVFHFLFLFFFLGVWLWVMQFLAIFFSLLLPF